MTMLRKSPPPSHEQVKRRTLTNGLTLLASTVISMIPPLILYFTSQRYFLQGISVQASVKG